MCVPVSLSRESASACPPPKNLTFLGAQETTKFSLKEEEEGWADSAKRGEAAKRRRTRISAAHELEPRAEEVRRRRAMVGRKEGRE